MHCNDYLRQRLETNGYEFVKKFADLDLFMRAPSGEVAWICYLEVEIDPEQIRRMFDFQGHVLIIVKESLIPDEIKSRDETPMWLRVLHGLYMGRVYVWNDRYLFGLHFDYDTGDVSESDIIRPDELLLVETGTWLRGWTAIYKLARFKDKAWWDVDFYGSDSSNQGRKAYEQAKRQSNAGDSGYQSNGYAEWQERMRQQQAEWERQQAQYTSYYTGEQKQSSSQQSARDAYEQARDHYWKQQRERAQRQQYDSDGFAYDPNDWPGGKPPAPPPKPDFMRQFAQAGSPSAVKALYRELAKKYHPDLNPGVDTTVEMQAVNAAYEKFR